jgi:hypothetical protein
MHGLDRSVTVAALLGLTRYNLRNHRIMGTVLIKKPAIDPRYTEFKLSIRESKIHQRGVYAEEPIPRGAKSSSTRARESAGAKRSGGATDR